MASRGKKAAVTVTKPGPRTRSSTAPAGALARKKPAHKRQAYDDLHDQPGKSALRISHAQSSRSPVDGTLPEKYLDSFHVIKVEPQLKEPVIDPSILESTSDVDDPDPVNDVDPLQIEYDDSYTVNNVYPLKAEKEDTAAPNAVCQVKSECSDIDSANNAFVLKCDIPGSANAVSPPKIQDNEQPSFENNVDPLTIDEDEITATPVINEFSHFLVRPQLVDSEAKPFNCPECNYRCARRNSLSIHMLKHSGVRPYKCTECKFTTSQRSNLTKHTFIHSGLKPHSCTECDFKAAQRCNLTAHMLIHSGEKPFKCQECDFSTAQRGNLNTHMLTHSGVKPYACTECDYRSTQRGNLAAHKQTHSAAKPHCCTKCDFKSAYLAPLTRHMVEHMKR